MSKKEKLSRGLQSLLGGVIGIEAEAGQDVIMRLNPKDIQPNDSQPRDIFDDEEMKGLVESIKQHGILQPIIVRPLAHGYMLIARRAPMEGGKTTWIERNPAIVRDIDGRHSLEIALIENIQREDLNPIEKAKGFKELINKFDLTQEQVAKTMGKERSSVTNYIRLLDLPQEIQDNVSRGTLSMGHARAILSVQGKELQIKLCDQIIKEGLSVRQIEMIVSMGKKQLKPHKSTATKTSTPHIEDLEDRFEDFLGQRS